MKTVRCESCGGTGKLPDQRAIGGDMRIRRWGHGIGLREIARRLKKSAAYISDLERGRRTWNDNIMDAYKKVLRDSVGAPKKMRKAA